MPTTRAMVMDYFESLELNSPTRQIKLARPSSHTIDVVRHVSKGWVPISKSSLTSARKAIAQKDTGSIDGVISAVKSDPGLFLWCARSLNRVVESHTAAIEPISCIRTLEYRELSRLFSASESEMSYLSLTDSTKAQVAQTKHALITSHAAVALALDKHIDCDCAFSSAQLMQSALTLIAWNYPRIYAQALARSKREHTTLEDELTSMLGIAPLQLLKQLSASWRMSPQLNAPFEANTSGALKEIIYVAELFAKTVDPTTYPDAKKIWDLQEKRIFERFSADTFSKLERIVTTVIETIRNTHPLASLLDEKKDPSFSRPALLLPSNLHNPSIAKCSPAVRALFAPIYDHITPGKLSVPAIQALVETSIPALKFPRGCLFIAGGPYSALRPLLRIGDVPLERYEYLVKESDTAILATPYSWIPYRGFGKGITGAITQSISNGLQSSKHSGIFYLELLTDTTEESAEMMYRFTAIEKSLLHALGEID